MIDATRKNVLVASNSGLPGVHDRRGDEGGQIKQFINGPKKGQRIHNIICANLYIYVSLINAALVRPTIGDIRVHPLQVVQIINQHLGLPGGSARSRNVHLRSDLSTQRTFSDSPSCTRLLHGASTP